MNNTVQKFINEQKIHLHELRRRIINVIIALLISFIISTYIYKKLLKILLSPLYAYNQSKVHIYIWNITGAFEIAFQMMMIISLIISSPVIIYNLIRFVNPGLYTNERKKLYLMTVGIILTLIISILIEYYLFPFILKTFLKIDILGIEKIININNYLDFLSTLLVVIEILLLVPVILMYLYFTSVLSNKSIYRLWRIVVLINTIFALTIIPNNNFLTLFYVFLPPTILYGIIIIIILIDIHIFKNNRSR